MNQRLGSTARKEIIEAMTGLVGKAAKAEAVRLAKIHDIAWQTVYKMTAHLRKGTRKQRSDAGRRKFDIVPGTDTFEAAALVIGAKLDPDQALITAKANGHENLPTIPTLQRLLRERGLNKKYRNTGRRNHRRFEAEAPLDLIQIDCTALKVRWQDINTRRILRIEGIDKNHPNLDDKKQRVWQILAVDDHSRRRFLRYVVTGHITSRDMVKFCCELFCEWGLPLAVYTDNGPEFKGFFNQATRILSSIPAISETGGYEHIKHAPNNPQASGKVEVAHKWAEKMDRYIGLAIDKGLDVTADKLDGFADAICRNYNEVHVNRDTGQTPLARWFGTRIVTRMLPAEVIQSALIFDEAERVIAPTMTVRVGKLDYRLSAAKGSPFRAGMRVSVIVPHELDKIYVTLPNGAEYECDKEIATVDKAGEFKTAQPSEGETLTKQLKEHHKQKNAAAKEQRKLTGETYQVPHFNHEIAAETTNVRSFPHPSVTVAPDELAAVTPVPLEQQLAVSTQQSAEDSPLTAHRSPLTPYAGREIDYWTAINEFAGRFASLDECKAFLLELFPGEQGELPITAIEAAIDSRTSQTTGGLRAVG